MTSVRPGSISQRLGEDFFDLLLELTVVVDPSLTFLSHLFGQRLGGAFAVEKAGPTIVEPVQLGPPSLAGAVGFAAGAFGGGNAPR